MEYIYKVNGNEYAVNIASIKGNKAQVLVNGIVYEVEMENASSCLAPVALTAAPVQEAVSSPAEAPAAPVQEALAAPAAVVEPATPAQETPAVVASGEGTPVKSPLPGIINDIKVAVGDKVKNGQTLLVLEAMKMENDITAEQDGTITSIAVKKGDSVMEGTVLVTIA